MNTTITKPASLERVRYYPRQLMTADDMRAEQEYFLQRMRRHNRLLHGWGIACGLEVQPAPTTDKPWQVRICPGFALSPQGDEIYLPAPVLFDLARPPSTEEEECVPCPCPPEPSFGSPEVGVEPRYLAIRYVSRPTRPVRLTHANCGCGDNGCETSRERDDYEIALLTDLPLPYDEASRSAEAGSIGKLKDEILSDKILYQLDTPTCETCLAPTGPWIILTTPRLIRDSTHPERPPLLLLDPEWRHALISVQRLAGALMAVLPLTPP